MFIALSPQRERYTPGTILIADVKSNPPLQSCKWVNITDHSTIASSCRLRIMERMAGKQFLRVEACQSRHYLVSDEKCISAEVNITVVKSKFCPYKNVALKIQ